MTQEELKQVKRLLVLADAAADFEHVDIKLVTHFHEMREELGLARLLLLVQEYVEHRTQSRPEPKILEASQQSQDSL